MVIAMNATEVMVPMSFLEMQKNAMEFFNQGAAAHRASSSQEEWETLWLKVLTKHGLENDTDMTSLVFTPAEDHDDTRKLELVH
jgi:hypothetical protein